MKIHFVAACMLVSVSAFSGCGVGVIYFEAKNGGPGPAVAAPAGTFKAYDVDCKDGFEATGGQNALGNLAGTYSVDCQKDGAAMTGKIVGIFHAAPMARKKWDRYRAEVTEKARKKGCPAVAVRKTAPTLNQQGEAIGAFCVES
jgi:hypothetical protein